MIEYTTPKPYDYGKLKRYDLKNKILSTPLYHLKLKARLGLYPPREFDFKIISSIEEVKPPHTMKICTKIVKDNIKWNTI